MLIIDIIREFFMIKIDSLKNNPQAIPVLSNIWYEVLGKIWMPKIGIEEIESLYYKELNQDMPLTNRPYIKTSALRGHLDPLFIQESLLFYYHKPVGHHLRII